VALISAANALRPYIGNWVKNMDCDHTEIQSKVDRLVQIKNEMEKLKAEQNELEGFFLKLCDNDLKNTKLKTVAYSGTSANRVTATMANNLKPVYPSFFREIFGSAYSDAVTEEIKYKLSAPASRMLVNLWQKSYTKMTVEEVIQQLPCDAESKTALGKKLKGANFKTDVKSLMAIAGFSRPTRSSMLISSLRPLHGRISFSWQRSINGRNGK